MNLRRRRILRTDNEMSGESATAQLRKLSLHELDAILSESSDITDRIKEAISAYKREDSDESRRRMMGALANAAKRWHHLTGEVLVFLDDPLIAL